MTAWHFADKNKVIPSLTMGEVAFGIAESAVEAKLSPTTSSAHRGVRDCLCSSLWIPPMPIAYGYFPLYLIKCVVL